MKGNEFPCQLEDREYICLAIDLELQNPEEWRDMYSSKESILKENHFGTTCC
jgi:hypothetical protein